MSLERRLRRTFAQYSGLSAHHAAINWIDSKYKRLEFDGTDQFGNEFHAETGQVKSSAMFRATIMLAKEQKAKASRNFIQQVFPEQKSEMAKPSEFSRQYSEFAKNIEKRTDELLSRLDGAKKRAPDAFNRANALMDQNEAELTAMEAELGQLSNLPLEK